MTDFDAQKAQFFDLSLDLLAVLDASGTIQLANAAFHRATGQPHLQGTPLTECLAVRDVPMAQAALDAPGTQSMMCRLKYHDGTEKWILWTLQPQQDDTRQVVGRDMTPFREMETKENERNIFAEALLDTVLAINSSLSLEQVLERILSNVRKVVAYDFVTLMLIDARGQAEVVGVAARPADPGDLHGRRFPIAGHLQTLYQRRESLIVPTVDNPPDWMTARKLEEAGSFLGAPIVVEEEVIGFFGVFITEVEYFTPLHAQQLTTFASQAGIAIQNARLYEQAASAAVLRERQRMAQELHDSVNQNLFAASTYADLLPRAIRQKPEAVPRYAADISRLVRSAVAQMRIILIELHPDALIKTDLGVLIRQLCNAFSGHTGTPVEFHTDGKIILPPDDQIAVYRIAQEALHNIDKHADAADVSVYLARSDDELCLHIADNGVGFDDRTMSDVQFGVRGMRQRAEAIGATLDIDSTPGHGTQITLRKKSL